MVGWVVRWGEWILRMQVGSQALDVDEGGRYLAFGMWLWRTPCILQQAKWS